MKQSFYGGVHPHDRKELARHKEIAPLSAAPKQVVIAMSMHIGAPCKPIVAVGDHVKVGQKIGEIAGLGAPIHASVSGEVKAVEPRPYVGGGKAMSVVIENDFQDTWGSELTPHPDYSKLSPDEIVNIVKEAGITGMGGAGFPTHVKISSGIGKVDTVILNGAECEPYITADHRLMLEHGEKVIGGLRILLQAFGLQTGTIGVEANKEDAVEHLRALVGGRNDITVQSLRTRYPQGAEKVLIENCTGREVPFPGLPSDVGVIVMNVTSVAFVSKYLETGMPLTTKRLTVDGDIVKEPKNVEVLIGTPIQELLDFCGGLTAQPGKVLYGGPMMGTCVADLSQPILKNNNAVLAFSEKLARLPKKTNCIHCGRCVNACPLGLAAKDIVKAYENGNVELLQELNADLCMSCGTCSFVCPAKRPLAPSIALAKIMMKNGGKK